jgi:hypothetical protein
LEQGEKVGVLAVRLFRPFSTEHFLAALPKTAEHIAVLDRTKEPGSAGEPLYLDVVTQISQAFAGGLLPIMPKIIGGRYGLSSKEFTPAMVKRIFEELAGNNPKNGFTIGITDDVSHTRLDYDYDLDIEPDSVKRCLFFGVGGDGTVGAAKNNIKIIGKEEHLQVLLQARAIENTMYIVCANQCGNNFCGRSAIFDPFGVKLADAGEEENIICCLISRNRIKKIRERLPCLKHLKEEIFNIEKKY